jgi:uncharacterized membrane protein required for colicin V production
MRTATNLLVLSMSTTFILLALQAEIITRVLGFIFGGMLAIAFVLSYFKKPE